MVSLENHWLMVGRPDWELGECRSVRIWYTKGGSNSKKVRDIVVLLAVSL